MAGMALFTAIHAITGPAITRKRSSGIFKFREKLVFAIDFVAIVLIGRVTVIAVVQIPCNPQKVLL